MSDAAFLEILRAAEAGEARFPAKNRPGLAGESDRLQQAEHLVFAEGEPFEESFAKLTEVRPDSPLGARAERLRLLRKNRARLKKSFPEKSPLTGPLFAALAAGPGPTLAKRRFEEILNTPDLDKAASELRRSLSERAYDVYKAERDWLKKVGPSRRTKGTGAWSAVLDRLPMIILAVILVAFVVIVCAALGGGGSPGGSGSFPIPIPVGLILWLVIRAARTRD